MKQKKSKKNFIRNWTKFLIIFNGKWIDFLVEKERQKMIKNGLENKKMVLR